MRTINERSESAKRLFTVSLFILIAFGLAACGGKMLPGIEMTAVEDLSKYRNIETVRLYIDGYLCERCERELQRVLDDTASFASEFFGLSTMDGQTDPDPPEERPNLTPTQMRNFLYSPLGDELATRIQLQPPYHGLIESDVVVVNTGVGRRSRESDECLRRITQLLERTRSSSGEGPQLFFCDPCAPNAKMSKKLLAALKPMCVGGC